MSISFEKVNPDDPTGPLLPARARVDENGAISAGISFTPTGPEAGADSTSVVPATDALFILGASEAHIGETGGKLTAVSATFTRPADTTAYAALDVVGAAVTANISFADAARVNAGSGYVAKARLMTDQSTNVARYRLHLYHTAPTAIADNAPMTLLWVNADKRVGYIDFAACKTEGTGSSAAGSINFTDHPAFVCAALSRNLFGILETLDAFTPATGQNYHVELTLEQY